MKILLMKAAQGFIPADDGAWENMKKFKTGEYYQLDLKEVRNAKFLRKFFAMIRVGFDAWEPPQGEYKGHVTQKNFDRFRKDVIISAGFYDIVVNLRGETRAEAKSIAFGNMSEEEFNDVYDKCAAVLLNNILKTYKDKDDLDRVVQQMLDFTNH